MKKIDSYRCECEREDEPFDIHAGLAFSNLDDVRRLEDLGISQLVYGTRGVYEADHLTLEKKREMLRRFAADVISKL